MTANKLITLIALAAGFTAFQATQPEAKSGGNSGPGVGGGHGSAASMSSRPSSGPSHGSYRAPSYSGSSAYKVAPGKPSSPKMAMAPHYPSNVNTRHRIRKHRSIFLVAPYSYPYVTAYNDSCYWLYRRAIETGSRYWWREYYQCRDYAY